MEYATSCLLSLINESNHPTTYDNLDEFLQIGDGIEDGNGKRDGGGK